ncbi:hypothetical protein [Alicyclobacillus acidoterrestris]|uniref:Uncharacterized protein n=1 Tax=Alicyclobacillus acidoterrestris (strain ATCC 49025 / DSM 3922 / CIP 106132 / NCIMB 13137 / GD3B) TaxID=1356854 RepID=T0BUG2_ALIAG|nr:hypothetical protein [Alicyclobacillus acidoterrestris]EPZ47733.1 hypothetical protein N007_05620 [Alicyclobacillus acidoterrestris ATCC 49025]UNO47959.1 hypothetical protein K1I37_14890 [Alicyclobacillus acidoterrestris]
MNILDRINELADGTERPIIVLTQNEYDMLVKYCSTDDSGTWNITSIVLKDGRIADIKIMGGDGSMNNAKAYRPLGDEVLKYHVPTESSGKIIDTVDNILNLVWDLDRETWRLNGSVYGGSVNFDGDSGSGFPVSLQDKLLCIERALKETRNTLVNLADQFDARG